jgi:hypothetical protein
MKKIHEKGSPIGSPTAGPGGNGNTTPIGIPPIITMAGPIGISTAEPGGSRRRGRSAAPNHHHSKPDRHPNGWAWGQRENEADLHNWTYVKT